MENLSRIGWPVKEIFDNPLGRTQKNRYVMHDKVHLPLFRSEFFGSKIRNSLGKNVKVQRLKPLVTTKKTVGLTS